MKKNIVISGSMSFYEEMCKYKVQLEHMGFVCIIPEEDNFLEKLSEEEFCKYKRKASIEHFKQIAAEDTYAILVLNIAKKGIENYIGANSFAEITIGFYNNKKLFLLNDFYQPYVDELKGWGVVPLNQQLDLLLD